MPGSKKSSINKHNKRIFPRDIFSKLICLITGAIRAIMNKTLIIHTYQPVVNEKQCNSSLELTGIALFNNTHMSDKVVK